MGFKASEKLTQLDYDFRPFSDLHGTIPEPSRQAVIAFNDQMAKGAESIGKKIEDPTDQAEVIRVYSEMSQDELNQLHGHMVDTISDLTQDHPHRDELALVPSRPFQAFQGWLQSEVNNPEAPAPAGRR